MLSAKSQHSQPSQQPSTLSPHPPTPFHMGAVGKKIPGGFATPGIFFIFATLNFSHLRSFL
jgi:hypothetical protein